MRGKSAGGGGLLDPILILVRNGQLVIFIRIDGKCDCATKFVDLKFLLRYFDAALGTLGNCYYFGSITLLVIQFDIGSSGIVGFVLINRQAEQFARYTTCFICTLLDP